jgi:hypothetical protein
VVFQGDGASEIQAAEDNITQEGLAKLLSAPAEITPVAGMPSREFESLFSA